LISASDAFLPSRTIVAPEGTLSVGVLYVALFVPSAIVIVPAPLSMLLTAPRSLVSVMNDVPALSGTTLTEWTAAPPGPCMSPSGPGMAPGGPGGPGACAARAPAPLLFALELCAVPEPCAIAAAIAAIAHASATTPSNFLPNIENLLLWGSPSNDLELDLANMLGRRRKTDLCDR
jgi:hypothetical protein